MLSRTRSAGLLLAIACSLAACGGSTEPTSQAPTIHLSASQAATLATRVAAIAPSHPEIAWLADSASLVLTSGAEADRVDVSTDLAAGPFYAVGLHRALSTSTNAFATFDFIAFDDPGNPANFIIVDGYTPGSGTTAPTSVQGTFGGAAVHAYLFHVAGSVVSAWRAQTGDAAFTTGATGGPCVGFQASAGVTCVQSALGASFSIASAVADNASTTGTRQATLATTSVAGILLTFQF